MMTKVKVSPISTTQRGTSMKVRAALFSVLWITLGLTFASEIPAQNAVADWHAVLESNVAGSGRKNAVALPFYAYVDVAMYDAVASINRRYEPFAVRVHAPRGASEDAAAASAAHDVLVHYLPSRAATLDAALATSLALIPDGPSKTDGIQVGQAVAASWLALRTGDGLEAPLVYTPGHGPGIWEPVPTYPAPPPNTPAAPVGSVVDAVQAIRTPECRSVSRRRASAACTDEPDLGTQLQPDQGLRRPEQYRPDRAAD